jgi:hypothetical protein
MDDLPLKLMPATAEYVLSVLQDSHRQQVRFDWEADPSARLSFDTTVAQWRDACDLVDWRKLGEALNTAFEVDVRAEVWHTVLEPSGDHQVREVCELIARRASMPVVVPSGMLGARCKAAGVFLVVREHLRRAGADAREIGPSTPLAEYARRYVNVFLGPISCLAPGMLPAIDVRTPGYYGCAGVMCVSACVMVLGWIVSIPQLGTLGGLLAVGGYAGVWIMSGLPPRSVTFGQLKTFRDLAVALAEGPPSPQSSE